MDAEAQEYCTLYNDFKHEVRMVVFAVDVKDITPAQAIDKLRALTALE